MTTTFPAALDNFSNPTGTQLQSTGPRTHSQQHGDLNDAVEALEAKVGITNSNDPNSNDYKIRNVPFTQTGTGAVARTLQKRAQDTLNAADFGVVADNLTDNSTALANVIAEAANRGGATILLPAGYVRHTQPITVSSANIKLRCAGSNMTHDAGSGPATGTCLYYLGPAGSDQITFASPTGASAQMQSGGGLEDVWLYGVCANNLAIRSWGKGEFRNLYMTGGTNAGLLLTVQTAALAEAKDSQHNVFERIYIDAGISGHGFWLDGDATANASFNTFINCRGRHKNGNMFTLANCDNNFFDTAAGFRVSGGTGLTVEFRGSNSGLIARSNHFRGLSGNGGVTARGTTSYTNASLRNTITGYDTDNSSPNPTIEAGAELIWSRDDGVRVKDAHVQGAFGYDVTGARAARTGLGNETIRIHNSTQNAVRITDGANEWAVRIDGSGNLNFLRIAGTGIVTVSNDTRFDGKIGLNGNTPVAKAAAITTPNAQTASYVQADVTSLKTAIDAIRVVLQNAGLTA